MSAPVAGAAMAMLVVLAAWRVRPLPITRPVPATSRRPSRRRRFHRRQRVDGVDIATYLEAMSRELRTGAALSAAFRSFEPAGGAGASAFATARNLVQAGVPVADALAQVVPTTSARAPDVALALQALHCAATVGGPAAATLDAAAAVLRERAAVTADLLAQSAQARLSARVLTFVPIGFAAWGVVSSARTRSAYLGSAVGAVSVVAGAALNLGGWWWMRRIIAGGPTVNGPDAPPSDRVVASGATRPGGCRTIEGGQ